MNKQVTVDEQNAVRDFADSLTDSQADFISNHVAGAFDEIESHKIVNPDVIDDMMIALHNRDYYFYDDLNDEVAEAIRVINVQIDELNIRKRELQESIYK